MFPSRPVAAKAWLLLAACGAVGAAAAGQSLIAAQSEVAYVATQTGVSVDGNFARFDAQINLDPDKPQSGSVSFTVDTASVVFPSDEVQRELAKPDWFDSAHYPKAEFRSTQIRGLGAGRYEISGALTIKGKTHPVVFPVTLSRSGTNTLVTGSLAIKRLDFGVGAGEWSDTSLVEDQVQIKFKIALSGKAG